MSDGKRSERERRREGEVREESRQEIGKEEPTVS